jgi:hypothetical protein
MRPAIVPLNVQALETGILSATLAADSSTPPPS